MYGTVCLDNMKGVKNAPANQSVEENLKVLNAAQKIGTSQESAIHQQSQSDFYDRTRRHTANVSTRPAVVAVSKDASLRRRLD